jgi:dTMP kinase
MEAVDQPSHGKFIVIEGGDSAGKHTQAELLLRHLQLTHGELELLSFPQYDTPFGELVAKYLRGEYGSLEEVPPEIPCLLYALDRYQAQQKLTTGLNSGKWFIADRYTQSNFAHQGAKFDGEARSNLIAWVESLESRLPQPDLVIYLHVPVDVAQKLMQAREHKTYLSSDTNQDIHELDVTYQQRVINTYLELARARKNWVVVECIDRGKESGPNIECLRSIDDIHQEIVTIVSERM